MSATRSKLPRQLYTAQQVRELDRIAIQDCGIDGFTLMRRAAAAALQVLLETWPQARHIIVFAGSGNNGGDGYVMAAMAKEQGLNPVLVQASDPTRLQGDALRAWQLARDKGVIGSTFDPQQFLDDAIPRNQAVVVDALLGTGLDRPVEGQYRDAIATVNNLNLPVVAVDVPSGICSDTGNILGSAVVADITVTFIGLKQGLLTGQGLNACGRVIYSDLDVPEQVFNGANSPAANCRRIDIHQVSASLQPRPPASHKGDFGHVLVVGGDYGLGGAALMAAEAALRTGAGLVSVITRSTHKAGFLARRPEAMVVGTEDEPGSSAAIEALLNRATVIVIGPGLGKSDWSRQLLQQVLQRQVAKDIPLVVDADGLNLLAEKAGAGTWRDNWVLTPHPGEAGRLMASDSQEIETDRFTAVASLQRCWGGVCLLKGAGSLLCWADADGNQHLELCSEGNPGMATGGMGDVLSGILGGFIAQGYTLTDSLRLAVCVHGESADLAAADNGQRGLLATDLFTYIPRLVNPKNYPD